MKQQKVTPPVTDAVPSQDGSHMENCISFTKHFISILNFKKSGFIRTLDISNG